MGDDVAPARRLAAILFTDLEGFTAEAHEDERRALRLLEQHEEIARPIISAHSGRQVKSLGDGRLLEFPNARDAIECAVALQRSIQEFNAREGVRSLQLRAGIHLGDVEVRDGDILGDAVNIASRIEPLAQGGGICLTGQVYDQVHNKVSYRFEKLGPQQLKGISEGVEVYRVVLPWGSATASTEGTKARRVAVLPLANISPDPADEYFADGLTEELITVLSQLRGLQVIARTSVVQYKGSPKPVGRVGAELGVSAVVEGSVRKAGDRLRITAQLIDVGSEAHLWAGSYDRRLDDIFQVQGEVAKSIAEALEVEIGRQEDSRATSPPTVSPESYLCYLRGRKSFNTSFSKESLEAASGHFQEAISLDPRNARAHAGLADATHLLGLFYRTGERRQIDEISRKHVLRALELDPDLAEAHSSLGLLLYDSNEWESAEREAQRALSLNPNYTVVRDWYAKLLIERGHSEEALQQYRLSREADPLSAGNAAGMCELLLDLRRLDELKVELDKLHGLAPDHSHYRRLLAWYLYALGETAKAFEVAQDEGGIPTDSASPDYFHRRLLLAQLFAVTGNRDRAEEILGELGAMPDSLTLVMGRAYLLAYLGKLDEFFRMLETYQRKYGSLPVQRLRLDPDLEPARKDPRYVQLLKNMKLA